MSLLSMGTRTQYKLDMRINSLTLRMYRNIDACVLDFPRNLNIFVGNNGQGKTNVIESIVYLSSARSFRVNDDKVLIQHNQPFCEISGLVMRNEDQSAIRFVLSDVGKYLTINGLVSKKLSSIMGLCNVVLFNPDDLNFFTFAPRRRRREIDFEMGKLSHKYVDTLLSANKLLSERNAYLKQGQIDDDYLLVLSQELAKVSAIIIKQRFEFTLKLQVLVTKFYQFLSDRKDVITFEYKGPVSVSDSTEADLLQKMHESLQRDRDFRLTHVGIHRDDFIFKINDVAVVDVSSQGQRRMLMLAFKFALVELIHATRHYFPILCLDDLFSELDEMRRRRVMELLHEDMQVFISTTDLSFINTLRDRDVFRFVEGNIQKEVI